MATEKTMSQRRQPCRTPVYTLKNGENLSLYSPLSFLLLFWQENYCDTVQRTLAGFLSNSEPLLYGWNIVDSAQNTKQSIMDVENSLLFKNLLENDVARAWNFVHTWSDASFYVSFPQIFPLCPRCFQTNLAGCQKLVLDWIWRSWNCLRFEVKICSAIHL